MAVRPSPDALARMRSWLTSWVAELIVPGAVRGDLLRLVSAVECAPVIVTLTEPPAPGTRVTLVKFDRYLHGYHGAVPGSVGVVIGRSGCSKDDDGVLVDWGDGAGVRADLDELAPV